MKWKLSTVGYHSWRDWKLGMGIVFGTLAMQVSLDVGPLHIRVFFIRK